jgi:hypothetical protein
MSTSKMAALPGTGNQLGESLGLAEALVGA